MQYKIVLAARVICRPDIMDSLDFIPGTETPELLFDTDSGPTGEIWKGYLELQEQQKTQAPTIPWLKVKRTASDLEIFQVSEAMTLFSRYMAGEDRDNFNAVKHIEVVKE